MDGDTFLRQKREKKGRGGLLGLLRFPNAAAEWRPNIQEARRKRVGRPSSGGKRKVSTRISIRTPSLSRWLRRISVTFIAPNWAEGRPGVRSQGYSPTSGHLKVQSNFLFASRLVVRLGSVVWRFQSIPHPRFQGSRLPFSHLRICRHVKRKVKRLSR